MRRIILLSFLAALIGQSPAQAVDRFSTGSNAYATGFYSSAARHWLALADKGHGPAQYNIGRMHYYGQGVARDRIEAYKWFLLAQENGVERSHLAARMIEERMTKFEIVQATLRAREWRDGHTRSH